MTVLALYARVSTREQTVAGQLDALRGYAASRGVPALEFVDEGQSGARSSRPALDALRRALRKREVSVLVVTKLDRLARSVRQLCELAEELAALGASLVVLDQALDTGTPSGRLLFHLLGAVAEFERELIRERVAAGLAAANRRGVRIGRPRRLDRRGIDRARRLAAAGRSAAQIATLLGVGRTTVQRALAK